MVNTITVASVLGKGYYPKPAQGGDSELFEFNMGLSEEACDKLSRADMWAELESPTWPQRLKMAVKRAVVGGLLTGGMLAVVYRLIFGAWPVIF